MEEINADREKHGKKPFDDDQTPPKEKKVTVSTTDPDSGIFHMGEHRKCFAYEAHTAWDGYKWWEYVYDECFDCVICPEYQVLHYSTTNRDGYREYKSRSYICKTRPTRHMCTKSANCTKTYTQHVWQEYIELAEDARHTPQYQALYKLRKEKIERVFADAKEKHGMRYTLHRGLSQVTKWVRLKFAAMNLKKLAMWKWRDGKHGAFNRITLLLFPIDTKMHGFV